MAENLRVKHYRNGDAIPQMRKSGDLLEVVISKSGNAWEVRKKDDAEEVLKNCDG